MTSKTPYSAAEAQAVPVYIVATGEIYEGQETYTRHADGSRAVVTHEVTYEGHHKVNSHVNAMNAGRAKK